MKANPKTVIFSFIVIIIVFYVIIQYRLIPLSLAKNTGLTSLICSQSNFKTEFTHEGGGVTSILNSDGTFNYFFDDFSSYKDSSIILEDFEKPVSSTSLDYKTGLSSDRISGKNSVKISESKISPVLISSKISSSIQSNGGYVTGWLKLANRKDVSKLILILSDQDGRTRTYKPLINLQDSNPNFYDRDDAYPNIKYNQYKSNADVWTDFWLNTGWNYLIWPNIPENFVETDKFDSNKIVDMRLEIFSEDPSKMDVLVDDFRFVKGLQKNDNPLSPNWYEPLGRAPYGIFDITNDPSVKLINVRQSQYLSNGDHGRMLTNGLTPLNFNLRTRFKLDDLGASGNDLTNTWFRLMYDFDPDYDPGHDWFGFYGSLEWNNIGLVTVIPVQRFYLQDQEPTQKNIKDVSKQFRFKNGVTYEVQLKVEGQKTEAWIYEAEDDCLSLLGHTEYTFSRQRNLNKRYPIGIEITGNVKAIIQQFEIAEIK